MQIRGTIWHSGSPIHSAATIPGRSCASPNAVSTLTPAGIIVPNVQQKLAERNN